MAPRRSTRSTARLSPPAKRKTPVKIISSKAAAAAATEQKSEPETPMPVPIVVKEEPSATSSTGSPEGIIDRKIPSILYAEDGSVFYPCKHCCRAFSNEPDMAIHVLNCAGGKGPFNKSEVNNNDKDGQGDLDTSFEDLGARAPRGRPKGTTKTALLARKLNSNVNIITIDSVAENINNLTDKLRNDVVNYMNTLLKESTIKVRHDVQTKSVVVETESKGNLPALYITSRNINSSNVEIKTTRQQYDETTDSRLPDIAEILETHLGSAKASGEQSGGNLRPNMSVSQENVNVKTEDEDTIILEDLDIHICKQCRSVYHTLEELIDHDKYEHRKMKKRYPPNELLKFDEIYKTGDGKSCPICAVQFPSKIAWPRHLQTHSLELQYECRICKKKFSRNHHRLMHEKRHVIPKNGDAQ